MFLRKGQNDIDHGNDKNIEGTKKKKENANKEIPLLLEVMRTVLGLDTMSMKGKKFK